MILPSVSQARKEYSSLIEAVLKGSEVILTKTAEPVARLVAYRGPVRPRRPASMEGEIRIAVDFDRLPPDMSKTFGLREGGE